MWKYTKVIISIIPYALIQTYSIYSYVNVKNCSDLFLIECFIGFYGWNCSEICKFPSYGEKCQGTCKCEPTLCDHRSGCKNLYGEFNVSWRKINLMWCKFYLQNVPRRLNTGITNFVAKAWDSWEKVETVKNWQKVRGVIRKVQLNNNCLT